MSTGIYIAERNGHCQHCGHRFFSSAPNPAPLCYHCKSAGRTVEVEAAEPVETPVSALASDPAYADVPDFASYADFAAYDADDLRDAALERELDASSFSRRVCTLPTQRYSRTGS